MIALRGAFGACHLNIARPHPVQGHTATFAFDMYGGNVQRPIDVIERLMLRAE